MYSNVIFVIIIIIGLRFINYKRNKNNKDIYDNNERNIINTVLSKLEFMPKFYKMNKKNNKIYIKCHYYSAEFSYLLSNPISYGMGHTENIIYNNNDGYYIGKNTDKYYKKLNNYDYNKNIGVIVFDIIIDMKDKYYKIITSYFEIINLIKDNEKYYLKILDYLENPEYYIQINNIYDNNLNFTNKYDELWFDAFWYKLNQNKNTYLYNSNMKFNISITNDINNFFINPILIQTSSYPHIEIEVSKNIDIKPHINNSSYRINKITSIFI